MPGLRPRTSPSHQRPAPLTAYLEAFQFSALPLPFWGVVALWLAIFAAGHGLFRRAQALSKAQSVVLGGDPPALMRAASPRFIVLQLAMGTAVMLTSQAIGDLAMAFLAGGWVLTCTWSVGINLRGILLARALARPGAATGAITLSPALVLRENGVDCFGAATLFLLAGLLTAQLALLGGALFTAATGVGCLRRARQVERAAAAPA